MLENDVLKYFVCDKNLDSFKNNRVVDFGLSISKFSFYLHNILMNIGVPVHMIGYSYISECICFMSRRFLSGDRKNIKEVFDVVAQIHNTSADCVNSNVRNAISAAYKTNPKAFSEIFGSPPRPSNSRFLNRLSCLLACFQADDPSFTSSNRFS